MFRPGGGLGYGMARGPHPQNDKIGSTEEINQTNKNFRIEKIV